MHGMDNMKLSIITINYNNAAGLKKTLDSVVVQTYTDFEHIIVDGASTDGSVDEIIGYSQSPIANRHKIIWLSEPDKGIYNAMNKGIRMAKGEYLLFLNSGDALENAEVVENFYKADIKTDIATGIEKEGNGHLIYPKKEEELSYSFFYDDTLMHQSTFIRRDAFERFGMYNEDNRIVSDWEWFFNAIMKQDASYEPLDFVVALFDGEGISNSKRVLQSHNEEREGVRQRILPRVRGDYNELKRLERVEKEFEFLKNGKLGWLVKMLLKLKAIKK
jgi:glycosyltransferase involved in cell wall biosynthesis